MKSRVAFVHTVAFLVDEFRRRAQTQLPEVDTFHILNESLLQDLLNGAPKPLVYRRVVDQIVLASQSRADLIVVTCSSTSPAVDIARQIVSQRVLKIDDPMAEAAVRTQAKGTLRIGVLCTAASTVEPSTSLLQAHGKVLAREVTIEPMLRQDAYEALIKGDRDRHDAIVCDAALALSARADVLVLAQASLAHLQTRIAETVGCPVLASPPLLMSAIERELRAVETTA
jgi:Asp/Glu/hydantoin racemase